LAWHDRATNINKWGPVSYLRPSSRLRVSAAALVLLVAGAISSCGKSSSSSASSSASPTAAASSAPTGSTSSSATKTSGTPDPCSLLTAAEASSYLGGTATHDTPKSEFRGVTCKWTADTSFLLVSVYKGKEFFSPQQQAPDGKTLSGVGDQAFVGQALAGAIKGDIVVVIGGFGANDHFEEALKAAVGRV
jgi:hypothetical protein